MLGEPIITLVECAIELSTNIGQKSIMNRMLKELYTHHIQTLPQPTEVELSEYKSDRLKGLERYGKRTGVPFQSARLVMESKFPKED